MKRIRLWFLGVILAVLLAGCNNTDASNGNSEEETQQDPTAVDKYEEALALLDEMTSMKLEIKIDQTTDLGTNSFSETSKQTVLLKGLGTDSFSVQKEEKITYDSYYLRTEETYLDGKMYYSICPVGTTDSNEYWTEMTVDEYIETMIPVQLLNSELYESIEMDSDDKLVFEMATEAEGWLELEGAVLIESEGSVLLGENGEIRKSTYNLVYEQNSAVITMKISLKVTEDTTDSAIEVPEGAEEYVKMDKEDYLAPYLLHHAIGYMGQLNSFSVSRSKSAISMAATLMYSQEDTMHLYGKEPLADIKWEGQLMDLATGQIYFQDTVVERYADGVYTYIYNDSIPESEKLAFSDLCIGVTSDLMIDFSDPSILESLEVGNYNGTLLLEFDYVDDVHEEMVLSIAGMMLSDPSILDTLATAYRTEEASGYIGIDLATGIPTACGMEFIGIHTIEGEEYELTYNVSNSIKTGHASTYEAITGEALPEVVGDVTEVNPLFYHVTGPDGQEMWLLGTIHLGDYRTGKLPQTIMDAFATSDALALEFDMDAFEEKMEKDPDYAMKVSQLYFYTDGTTTKDHVSDEELYDYAWNLMKATGLAGSYAEQMKPAFWASELENYYGDWNHDLSYDYGVDQRLLDMAEEANKKILDVENGYDQIKMMGDYSDTVQEYLLGAAVSGTIYEYNEEVREMYEMWCNGDEAQLIAYLNDVDFTDATEEEIAAYEEYSKAMDTDRNKKMLDVAKGYLESDEVVFFAVGLAHLLADDGLVNTLRDAGYTVELVTK